MRTAILVVSTQVSRRKRPDETGALLAVLIEAVGAEVAGMEVVPHDPALIEDRLNHFVEQGCELILTTGGTGPAPEHATPEATWAIIEREVPGLPEAMRAGEPELRFFRGVAGLVGSALVVNLPGAPDLARGAFEVLAPLVARG